MSSLCSDKDDKCIISKLNIYRQNSRKGRAGTTAQSMTLRNAQFCVRGAHPPCATTQLCPLLTVQFSPLPSLQTLSSDSLHLRLTSRTGTISPRTEIIQRFTCSEAHVWLGCLLHRRDGRLKSHLSVGTVL